MRSVATTTLCSTSSEPRSEARDHGACCTRNLHDFWPSLAPLLTLLEYICVPRWTQPASPSTRSSRYNTCSRVHVSRGSAPRGWPATAHLRQARCSRPDPHRHSASRLASTTDQAGRHDTDSTDRMYPLDLVCKPFCKYICGHVGGRCVIDLHLLI